MNNDLRLYCDDNGVVHWRYAMAAPLTLCGVVAPRTRTSEVFDTTAPTCWRCLVLVEEHQVFPRPLG